MCLRLSADISARTVSLLGQRAYLHRDGTVILFRVEIIFPSCFRGWDGGGCWEKKDLSSKSVQFLETLKEQRAH